MWLKDAPTPPLSDVKKSAQGKTSSQARYFCVSTLQRWQLSMCLLTLMTSGAFWPSLLQNFVHPLALRLSQRTLLHPWMPALDQPWCWALGKVTPSLAGPVLCPGTWPRRGRGLVLMQSSRARCGSGSALQTMNSPQCPVLSSSHWLGWWDWIRRWAGCLCLWICGWCIHVRFYSKATCWTFTAAAEFPSRADAGSEGS